MNKLVIWSQEKNKWESFVIWILERSYHSVIIRWTQPDSPFPNRRILREGNNLGSGTQSGVALGTMPCFSLISFLLLFPCPVYSGNRFQTVSGQCPSIYWFEVSGSFLALDFINRMCNQDTEESHIYAYAHCSSDKKKKQRTTKKRGKMKTLSCSLILYCEGGPQKGEAFWKENTSMPA